VFNDFTLGSVLENVDHAVHDKAYDGFATYGPAVVTGLRSSDLAGLSMQCRVNGEVVDDTPCDLIYSPEDLVSWLSHIFTLYPGDVIATGAPNVGTLVAGDTIEVEIEGLGSLRNEIVPADHPHRPAR
jgi:2-keto-4-pentenoate hydratase/2-oxohepta-3-ene-1,7-dioic acid hydratase in catechol pathway